MADVYASRADLYRYGLPRGMLATPARLCASATAATDVIELDGHGFETGDELLFRAEAGGSLPSPLVAGTTYYAIRLSDATFKVAATSGGAALDLTTAGSSFVVAATLPVDDVLEAYSRFVDDFMPAHMVPLAAPYPSRVVMIVAELAAKKLLLIAGQSSQSMTEAEVGAKAQLERWAAGVPLRDARATAPTNRAISRAVTTDPRGWGGGGTIP